LTFKNKQFEKKSFEFKSKLNEYTELLLLKQNNLEEYEKSIQIYENIILEKKIQKIRQSYSVQSKDKSEEYAQDHENELEKCETENLELKLLIRA
jgi:hypothetical protein